MIFSKFTKAAVFFGVSLVYLMFGLFQTGIFLVINEIANDLAMCGATIKWMMYLPLFGCSVLTVPVAKLYDAKNEKNVFSLFLIIYSVGSMLCFCSQGIFCFIFGRILQTIGIAALMPGSYVVIRGFLKSASARPEYFFGIFMSITTFLLIVNTAISGLLAESFGWRSVFLFMAFLGVVTLVLVSPYKISFSKSLSKPSKIFGSLYFAIPAVSCLLVVWYGLNIYVFVALGVSLWFVRVGLTKELRENNLNCDKSIFLYLLVISAIQSIQSVSGLLVLACREVFELDIGTSGILLFLTTCIGVFTPLFSQRIDRVISRSGFVFSHMGLLIISQILVVGAGFFLNLQMMLLGRVIFSAVSTLLLTKCTWILINELGLNDQGFINGLIQQTRYLSGAVCFAISSAIAFAMTNETAILTPTQFSLSMLCPLVATLTPVAYLFLTSRKGMTSYASKDKSD